MNRGRRADRPVSPVQFATTVVAQLRRAGEIAAETLELVCPCVEHFGSFAEHGLGINDIDRVDHLTVARFMCSVQTTGIPSTWGARRIRRMSLRLAFRTGRMLGIVRGDPTLDVELGPGSSTPARPLTDHEIEVGRSFAIPSITDMRRCMAWALCEATGRTSEIGFVRVRDVDIALGRVWLPGAARTDARWGQLSDWGWLQVRRRVAAGAHPADGLIAWRSEPKAPRSASSQAVTETLKAAGLHAPDVRPRSIVAWAGHKLLEEGETIDEVARRLGMRSLDQTAEFIGFEWRGKGRS